MKKLTVQHRVAPRVKECPLCRKPVTMEHFDDKKATYARIPGLVELGLRWHHLSCRVRRNKRTATRRRTSDG
jgi:hypothetical protein